jgi:hypothetical protein
VGIVLLAVIILVTIVVLKQLNNQKENVSLETKNTETGETKIYNDGYIIWEYPSKYEISKIETTDGRVITNVMLADKSTGIKYTINLTQLTQGLDDIPSVQMRRLNKNEYTEEVGMMGDLRGLLFRTIDRKERMFFVKNKNAILTILMATNSDSTEIEEEFQTFLKSFKWL